MRDIDIRDYLHRRTLKHYHEDPTSCVLDELGLCQGETRVDIAVVNGEIHGFEIKSTRDKLTRLPKQINLYSRVLDKATLVVSQKKLESVLPMLPDWWGILVASEEAKTGLSLKIYRKAKKNKTVDSRSLVELLWKSEAYQILFEHNLHVGISKKPRQFLWDALVSNFSLSDLQHFVRANIKQRGDWRAVKHHQQKTDIAEHPLPQPLPINAVNQFKLIHI